jgi:organic radical activating enzyme
MTANHSRPISVMSSVFTTCPLKCGYCTIAESGAVLDNAQLEPYRNLEYVHRIADFFNKRTDEKTHWNLELTGGDPLLMPNLPAFCDRLFLYGNQVSFYTSLFFNKNNKNFQYLLTLSGEQVNYIMASFHPEAEPHEDEYFEKVALLKEAGHHTLIRFVAHPKRFAAMRRIEQRCKDLDVCFYPTNLMSRNYPAAYTPEEKEELASYFSAPSQLVLLEGGIDTNNVVCHAGRKNLAVDFLSGAFTPCILLSSPIVGNLHEDWLSIPRGPIRCPNAKLACNCDAHFQWDIVPGAESHAVFEKQKKGFVPAMTREEYAAVKARIESKKLRFAQTTACTGQVQDDSILILPTVLVKAQLRASKSKSA